MEVERGIQSSNFLVFFCAFCALSWLKLQVATLSNIDNVNLSHFALTTRALTSQNR